MKVFACQLDIVWENKTANFSKVRGLLEHADVSPGSLVLLPEMFSTGFSMEVERIHESVRSETAEFLGNLAAEYKSFVVGGLVTRGEDGRGRNEAAAFDPTGKEIARYCKIHPFTFGGEAQHYAPGTDVRMFQWHELVVTPFVCYDLRFPEIFREAVRRGAQLFAVIANWPAKRVQHWTTLLQARAIENQAYVVGVNRSGHDPKLAYPGRSLIIDPKGEVLADGGNCEGVINADLDVAAVLDWRKEFPALQDMKR